MSYIKYQKKILFYQRGENSDQKKQRIYQELLHKTTKPFHYTSLSNHRDLNILITILRLTYRIKQLKNIIQQKKLLDKELYNEPQELALVLTILKCLFLGLQSIPFSIHQKKNHLFCLNHYRGYLLLGFF